MPHGKLRIQQQLAVYYKHTHCSGSAVYAAHMYMYHLKLNFRHIAMEGHLCKLWKACGNS